MLLERDDLWKEAPQQLLLDEDDLYIGSGNVSGLETVRCWRDSGITGNDSNYTKVSISGGTSDLQGFSITISDVNGYLLYDGGTSEANATTGAGLPEMVHLYFLRLTEPHEIVASGNGYVVLNLQRMLIFLILREPVFGPSVL